MALGCVVGSEGLGRMSIASWGNKFKSRSSVVIIEFPIGW